MKRQFFTLVELLLVIAIIAILAGIAIPVVGGMNKKGRETKARAEINAIVTAIKQYEADYGTLPFIPDDKPADDIFITSKDNTDKYDEVMEILMNLRPDGADFSSAKKRLGNPKNKRYLDPPSKKVKVGSDEGYYFLDPWGRRYNIALDTGYDGKVNLAKCTDETGDNKANFGGEPVGTASNPNYLMGKVFVFSYGYKGPAKNINDAQKNYITSWKTSK